jgi:hypothetical protein
MTGEQSFRFPAFFLYSIEKKEILNKNKWKYISNSKKKEKIYNAV